MNLIGLLSKGLTIRANFKESSKDISIFAMIC